MRRKTYYIAEQIIQMKRKLELQRQMENICTFCNDNFKSCSACDDGYEGDKNE